VEAPTTIDTDLKPAGDKTPQAIVELQAKKGSGNLPEPTVFTR
jgi:hypothetical protein